MNNELQKHKISDTVKWVLTLLAFILVGVMLTGIILGWFDKKEPQEPQEQSYEISEAIDSNVKVARTGCNIASAHLSANSDYSVSLLSESSDELSEWLNEHTGDWSSVYATNQYVTIPLKSGYNGSVIADVETWVIGYKKSLPKGGTADYFVRADISDYIISHKYFTLSTPMTGVTSGISSTGEYFYYKLSKTSSSSSSEVELTANYLVSGSYVYCTPKNYTPLPANPVKEGYTFKGWYFGSDSYCSGNCTPYENNVIFEDTVLHAHFEINKYEVTFNSAGGFAVDNISVEWNNSITPDEPKRTGYSFLGWFKDDGTKYEGEAITSDIVLTAHWEIIMLTVTFYVDGKVYETKKVEYGSILSTVMEEAQSLNLSVRTISFANGETPSSLSEASAITCNLEVDAVKNENTSLTIISVCVGVVGIAFISWGVYKLIQAIKRRNV